MYEIEISLAGENRQLRYGFAEYCGIEDALAAPLMLLARRFTEQNFGARDVVAIIVAGLTGAGEKGAFAEIGEKVLADGVAMHVGSCVQVLAAAVHGTAHPPASAKPRPGKKAAK